MPNVANHTTGMHEPLSQRRASMIDCLFRPAIMGSLLAPPPARNFPLLRASSMLIKSN